MSTIIEKIKFIPFPLPKRKVKRTIFPKPSPLVVPAHSKQVYSTFEEARKVLEEEKIQGKIISKRNKKKDKIEEVLSNEEFETKEEAERVKRELEVETDFSKVLVKIINKKKITTKEKKVKMLFLSEWERDNYIHYLKQEGYSLEEVLSKEEPRIEVFSFTSVYETYEEAETTLKLLQKHYKREGKIIFLDEGKYEVFISGVKESEESLYILEVTISKVYEKDIYELEIKNCIKGFDYEITSN